MASKKYYAVAKGKTPGIYMTWDDCKAQVEHFPGAMYKGFMKIEEAEAFLFSGGQVSGAAETEEEKTAQCISDDECLVAYVDGSYDDSQKRYAYGCALVFADDVIALNGSDDDEDYLSMRNVAGEILGSEKAIEWAVEHHYKKIKIFHDYEGVEKWANDLWKANKVGTQRYKTFVAQMRQSIHIEFHKVAAHTGDTYNELADQLAKKALGL